MTTTLQHYLDQVQRLVHDVTNATFTQTELVDYINTAREDTCLDMHCYRTLYQGVQLIPGQEIYPINGAVVGATVTNGGTYTAPPTVTFDSAPLSGTTAQGVPVMDSTGTIVTGVNLTQWGSNYNAAPNITFTPPGATATSIYFNNVFQVISITNIWNEQRYMLNFRGFTLFQAYFRAWTTQFMSRPGIWTMHPQMLEVFMRPMPDQQYFSEWDVIAMPTPLVNVTDVDTQVIIPWNKAVQFRASAIALMKGQNFQQAEYYEQRYDQRIPKYITGAGGYRIPNPYNRTMQRRVSRV